MKRYLRHDFKRVGHAIRVADTPSRSVGKKGANLAVILCAAYLQDLKSGSEGTEAPSMAREILTRLGAKEVLVDEVCRHDRPYP